MSILKYIKWFLVSVAVVVLTACGGGGSGGDSGGSRVTPVVQKTISGYVEDDPIANAHIVVKDSQDGTVGEASTDENGLYSLTGTFEEGKTYHAEAKGVLDNRNITLHSIFIFDESSPQFNINPLTELQYQLVMDEHISLEDSEMLIREYFNIANGYTLQDHRFVTTEKAYLGMKSVAELYNGVLPVDAVGKIKEDIVRNNALDANQPKDFSYRSLVRQEIELEVSANSLALGESVTINVAGIDHLNENYTIKWSGIPEDANGSEIAKIFTVNDFAKDVFVNVSLHRVDSDRSQIVSTANTVVNFYKELEEQTLIVVDASVDNNFTVGSNLNVTVPAGVVSNGNILKIKELQTNSDTSLTQFHIDGNINEAITFNYQYNPYIILDPRNLQISLRNGGNLVVLKVNEVDYINHMVRFEVPLNFAISRGYGDVNELFIEYINRAPSSKTILDFFGTNDTLKYKSYLEDVLLKYLGSAGYYGNGTKGAEVLLFGKDDDGHYNGLEKLTKVLSEKETDGEYKFNHFVAAINTIKAYEISKRLNRLEDNFETSWIKINDEYLKSIYGYDDLSPYERRKYAFDVTYRMIEVNKVPSAWIGNIKLTYGQTKGIKYLKFATNTAIAMSTSSGLLELGIGAGGVAIDALWPADLGANAAGYTYSALTNTKELLNKDMRIGTKDFSVSFLKDASIGFAVNSIFAELEKSWLENNAVASAPIWLSLYYNKDEILKINYINNGIPRSRPLLKNEFLDILFPSVLNCSELELDKSLHNLSEESFQNKFYCDNRDLILNAPDSFLSSSFEESSLSATLDPTKRLEELFIGYDLGSVRRGNGDLSEEERALAYLLLRNAYGDSISNVFFEGMVKSSEAVIFKYLQEAIRETTNLELEEFVIMETPTGAEVISKVKAEYSLTTFDKFLNFLGVTRSLRSNNNLVINDINNILSFQTLMEKAKLNLTNIQLEALNIKKIKVEAYGVELEYSEDDNVWTLSESDKVSHIYEATQNINNQFTYNSDLKANILSLATLFSSEDFTKFDNKLVGAKITLVFENGTVEKVYSEDFVFTTLEDTKNLIQTNFTGTTLKSSVKDATTDNPIVNAQVTLVPGGLTGFTDAEGNYDVSGLAAGSYSVIISKVGYQQSEALLTLKEDEIKSYETSLVADDEYVPGSDLVTLLSGGTFYNRKCEDDYIRSLVFNEDASSMIATVLDGPESGKITTNSISIEGNRVIFNASDGFLTFIETTNEYLLFDETRFYFDQTKAEASPPASDCDNESILITDLVSGHVTFKDENNNNISIPSDAWVRIVPSRYQIEGTYTGVNCKIDLNGNFGNNCYIHRNESEMRNAFNDSSETFQVVVYAETTGDTHWEAEEHSYGFLGNNVSNGAWSNFTIGNYNFIPDNSLTVNISLSDSRIIAVFNKDMRDSYHTQGDYIPTTSYWSDSRTFVMELESYTPGGTVTLIADGFRTTENKIMPNNVTYSFPFI